MINSASQKSPETPQNVGGRSPSGMVLALKKRVMSHLRRWKSQLAGKVRQSGILGTYDLVFVIHRGNKGWILEAICREIATYFPGKYYFHYSNLCHSTAYLPPAKAYFFSHYALLPICLEHSPFIATQKLLVWYTHPKSLDEFGITEKLLYHCFSQVTKVVCTCTSFVDLLAAKGVANEKLACVLGGADPELFLPHQRANGRVGFCTAYYARKSPDLILNIIKAMPHRKFILVGKDWQQYERFSELNSLDNLLYVEAPYSDYPSYYAMMDVFVSAAKLEGGPIPLVEAMMCNVVPVASKTGFAPDLITQGENGFLFDLDAPLEEVCTLIESAFEIKTDVRQTVEHLSWKNFSQEIQKLLQ